MKKYLIPILLGGISFFICNACSELSISEQSRTITVKACFSETDTRAEMEQPSGSLDLIVRWKEDDKIRLYLLQDGTGYTLDPVPINNISQDGKTCSFEFRLPNGVSSDHSYEIFGLCDAEGRMGPGETVFLAESELQRVPWDRRIAPMWFHATGGSSCLQARFRHLGTYELLHVTNTTNQRILFSHNGFEVEVPWYKAFEHTPLREDYDPTQHHTTSGERISQSDYIDANMTGTYLSWYIPSGALINDARLLAEIDGVKVASTNTKSSNVRIQVGRVYHMYAVWDGMSLSFKDGNSQVTIITGDAVDIQSNSAIIPVSIESQNSIQDCGVVYSAVDPSPIIGGDACSTVAADNASNAFEINLQNLLGMTKYYARGYANVGMNGSNEYAYGNVIEFTTSACELATEPTEGELIDLGLSVSWASCNVGASLPQEAGDFFAWGEVETKSTYDWSDYKHSNGTAKSLTKYCTDPSYGTVDNKTTLEFADDAAYLTSQGKMRIPTTKECQELIENCKWTRTTYKEQIGYLIASPKTGKAIFLPCNGLKYNDLWVNHDSAYYWTSDLSSEANIYADHFGGRSVLKWNRQEGLSIRAVSDTKQEPAIEVDPAVLQFGQVAIGFSATKTVTVTNTGNGVLTFHLSDADDSFIYTPDEEVSLEAGQSCEISISFRPKTVSQVGSVFRVFSNASNGTKYIECNGEGIESAMQIVDMGLSVKWASCNLGASSPEGYGDYYAWGEVEKKEVFSWATYKWCNGSSRTLTKYNTDSSYGAVDNRLILEPEDDVAHVTLGGKWRMPTKAEQDELIRNCDIVSTQVNGVQGRLFTSRITGNSIFLPTNGYYHSPGSTGEYWSSSLWVGRPFDAYDLDFTQSSHLENEGRYESRGIRPVYDDSGLVYNGNFEGGNTGFTSDYTYVSSTGDTALRPEGLYTVGSNPRNYHSGFITHGDHTSGSGKMLIANGSPSVSDFVWKCSFDVERGVQYEFSAWFLSVSTGNPLDKNQIEYSIGDEVIAGTYDKTENDWERYFYTYTAKSTRKIEIKIRSKTSIASGNDFALDDIYFIEK